MTDRQEPGRSGVEEHRTHNDWSSVRPSQAVVETVASARDVGQVELSPLYDRLDPDALDALVTCDDASVEVTLEYEGYLIRARADGVVSVRQLGE